MTNHPPLTPQPCLPMKNPDLTTRISKHLSFVLRHLPESIGITLDAHGWTDIATLIRQMNAHGTALDRALAGRGARGA